MSNFSKKFNKNNPFKQTKKVREQIKRGEKKKNFWTTKVGSVIDDITTSVSGDGTVYSLYNPLSPKTTKKIKNIFTKKPKAPKRDGSGALLEGFVYGKKTKSKTTNKPKNNKKDKFNWGGN
jgi:hypothetical protein